jgi:DNA-directed RNA polymerase subunit L
LLVLFFKFLNSFEGYRVPHPLTFSIEIKIQTKSDTSPKEVFASSLTNLKKDFGNLEAQFKNEMKKYQTSTNLW